MASSPMNKIERAHLMYREGRNDEALGLYTKALSMAKTKSQKIALHSNRAACYLKLHVFKRAHGIESIFRNVSKSSPLTENTTGKSLAPIPESEAEVDEEVEEEQDEEKNKAESEDEQVADEERKVAAADVEDSKGWQTIPKPKGHSNLDYSRWDSVEDDSSESDDDNDDDNDIDSQPQFKFRVRTVGVRPVK